MYDEAYSWFLSSASCNTVEQAIEALDCPALSAFGVYLWLASKCLAHQLLSSVTQVHL